ncbi:MAG: tyrosine-protein phosphatase [Natronospirillum sp.]
MDRIQLRSARLVAWVDLTLFDFGLLRAPVNWPMNVGLGVWRSNQPGPVRLKRLARREFKTVLNLRGANTGSAYCLEHFYCDRLGLQLVDFKMSSRRPPKKEQLVRLWSLFDQLKTPVLVHCKSGADRAGLVSALYQVHQGVPIQEARRQLSFRYLHIKHASTGILDMFLDAFQAAQSTSGIEFLDWVANEYDPQRMAQAFKARGPGTFLVDKVLRRE